jgi:hypothetical protein
MIYKLLSRGPGMAVAWNEVRLVPLVRAGAGFVNGRLVERNEEKDAA